jgi:uncharacterized membrane protein YfcA
MDTLLYALPIAFAAGFIDAIAGGGGLIQIPGLMLLLPNTPIVTLLGTNKLASCFGTMMSSIHYLRTLKINLVNVLPTLIFAFVCSMLGAKIATIIDNRILEPLVFIMLLVIGIYALANKKMGLDTKIEDIKSKKLHISCIAIGSVMGLYDGFFGPGTGSLLMFCFVGLLGFSFLMGSALTKMTNFSTNLAAMILFASTGHILYEAAIPMAFANILGNLLGAKLAIKKGSKFVRIVFLFVVTAILLQFLYQYIIRFNFWQY